jgi:site-specific DNA-methyltransferase (adenine-specific)
MERKQKVYNGKSDRPAGCADGSVEDKFTTQPARNHHPTVKPLSLMRWLVRLVTPPGGVVLDPFTGSGTTGMAAVMEGFAFIGVEQDAEYIEIARRRIAWAQEQQPPLLRATGD